MSTPHLIRHGEAVRLPVFGTEVEVLVDGTTSHGESAVYRVTAAPGVGAPLHRHTREAEMFHGLEGEFELVCGDTAVRLGPGDFAFAPRGVAHRFTCTSATPARMVVFSTPAGHERFFQDCAAAIADGTFGPETGAAICARHGIELLGP